MNTYFLKSFKGENYWWRYLFMIIILLIATQIGSLPLIIVSAIKSYSSGEVLTQENIINFQSMGLNKNLGLFLLSLPFAVGLVMFLVLIKPMHKRTITDTLTGRKQFDFNRFGFAALIWGSLMIFSVLISYITEPEDYTLQFDFSQFIILLCVSGIFITMQSTFEEIIFRGYFQQGLATLFKNMWIPLIITSALFGVMHISNPEVKEFGVGIMLPQYMLLGLVFGICVIMDEGLEIAIGVHVANNVLSSLLITHESSVLQTPSIFRVENLDPQYAFFELIIFSSLFIFIVAKKYKWDSFKKIFEKVKPIQ